MVEDLADPSVFFSFDFEEQTVTIIIVPPSLVAHQATVLR